MKTAKEERIEEQRKNIEEEMMSEKSKEAYNTLKALTKSQQHKWAVIEDSSGNILTERTTVLNQWTEYCNGLYNYELHPDTSLLQSYQTPHERLKAYLCWGKRLKSCAVWKQESLQEWTTFPLSCLRMEARQKQ